MLSSHAMQAPGPREYVLTVSCPDTVGLVAAVSSLIASWGGWLTEVANHSDRVSGRFFMRNVVAAESLPFGIEQFVEGFRPLALRHAMEFTVRDTSAPKRVLVLVSREGHCLADLLYRWRTGELRCDLRGVISNHDDLRGMVEREGVAFHQVPVPATGKDEAFAAIDRLFEREHVELAVLARFMQLLPPAMCARWSGRVVNSTTASCRPSRAAGLTSARSSAGSSSSARRATSSPPTSTKGRSSSRTSSASTTPTPSRT